MKERGFLKKIINKSKKGVVIGTATVASIMPFKETTAQNVPPNNVKNETENFDPKQDYADSLNLYNKSINVIPKTGLINGTTNLKTISGKEQEFADNNNIIVRRFIRDIEKNKIKPFKQEGDVDLAVAYPKIYESKIKPVDIKWHEGVGTSCNNSNWDYGYPIYKKPTGNALINKRSDLNISALQWGNPDIPAGYYYDKNGKKINVTAGQLANLDEKLIENLENNAVNPNNEEKQNYLKPFLKNREVYFKLKNKKNN